MCSDTKANDPDPLYENTSLSFFCLYENTSLSFFCLYENTSLSFFCLYDNTSLSFFCLYVNTSLSFFCLYENTSLSFFCFQCFERNQAEQWKSDPWALRFFSGEGLCQWLVLGWEGLCLPAPLERWTFHRPQTQPPIAVNPLFRERGLTETQQPCPNHCNLIHHISMMKMTHQHFIRSLSVLMGNIVLKALEKIDVPFSKTVDGDFMHTRGHNWPQDTN